MGRKEKIFSGIGRRIEIVNPGKWFFNTVAKYTEYGFICERLKI